MNHRLKKVRRTLEMNQSDFAALLGLSQSTLAMIESGKRNMNIKHIKLVVSVFGVNEGWLRTGEGDMFASSPYSEEFQAIFQDLRPETQQYLLNMARGLLHTQNQLLSNPSVQKDN